MKDDSMFRPGQPIYTAEKCPRFGKTFGGCEFEARYDESAADITYVRDVCIRCGKTVERY